jgi:hypothetical protein
MVGDLLPPRSVGAACAAPVMTKPGIADTPMPSSIRQAKEPRRAI